MASILAAGVAVLRALLAGTSALKGKATTRAIPLKAIRHDKGAAKASVLQRDRLDAGRAEDARNWPRSNL